MRRVCCYIIIALMALVGVYRAASAQLFRLHQRFADTFTASTSQGFFCYRELKTDCGSWYLPDPGIRSERYALQHITMERTHLRLEAEETLWRIFPCRHTLEWEPEDAVIITSSIPALRLSRTEESQACYIICCVLAEGEARNKLQTAPVGSNAYYAAKVALRNALQDQLDFARLVKDPDAERRVLSELASLPTEEKTSVSCPK